MSKDIEKSKDNENRDLYKIPLVPTTSVDLSFLPEDVRKTLMADHVKGLLDIKEKAQELEVDSACLKKTLDDLAGATREVAEGGGSVTITNTQTTKVGRTEIIMGNTDEARSGKLTKSQSGIKDWTPFYILAAIAAVIIIVSMIMKSK
jgi:hypothetical protein